MIRFHLHKLEANWFASMLVLSILLVSAKAGSLRTVERKIPSYAWGVRTYTCLAIDGGVVPLVIPNDATLECDGDLKIVWPKDRSSAVIRKATATETSLVNQMDQPEGPRAWKDYLAEQIKKDFGSI